MTIEYPDKTQLIITRTFLASPEQLFGAFTEPEQLERWIWGPHATGVEVVSDARVGGRWSAYMDAPATDPQTGESPQWPGDRHGMRGVFAVVDRPERIVYTLNWDAPVGYNSGPDTASHPDEAVVIDFAAADDGTVVTFRHVGIPGDGVSVHEHAKGIDSTLATLESLFS